MKKSILALLAVSALSTSAFAAGINKGDSVSDDLRFQEKVVRVCGIKSASDVGTIKFGNENGTQEAAAKFIVVDNGAHKSDGQTEISINTKRMSENLELAGATVKYAVNNIYDPRDSINHAPVSVGVTQEVFATVDSDKTLVNTGVARIKAVVEVHCGN
jgi:hypothetical protein